MTRPINPREVVFQLRALSERTARIATLLDRLALHHPALLRNAELMRDTADNHERLARVVEQLESENHGNA